MSSDWLQEAAVVKTVLSIPQGTKQSREKKVQRNRLILFIQ